MIHGLLIAQTLALFKDYRGPNGEHFSRTYLQELLMGRLSAAWQKEQEAKSNLQSSLDAANQTIQQLSAAATMRTPGGYTLDADDLKTVDEIIGTVPIPDPAVPTGG